MIELLSSLDFGLIFYLEDEKEDFVDGMNLNMLSFSVGLISLLIRIRYGGYICFFSSGCEFKRYFFFLN